MVNDVTSPEVEELMAAFEAMTTVVKFANMSLGSGDIDLAQYTYCEAKALFTKLGNDRGVSEDISPYSASFPILLFCTKHLVKQLRPSLCRTKQTAKAITVQASGKGWRSRNPGKTGEALSGCALA